MSILCTTIAHGQTILVSYSMKQDGGYHAVKQLLSMIDFAEDGRKVYTYIGYYFHVLVDGGLAFICISEGSSDRRTLPFEYLSDLRTRFLEQFGERWKTTMSYGVQTEYGRVIRQLAEQYNHNAKEDRVVLLEQSLSEVKDVIINNLDKVLARGEAVEDTLRRTDQIAMSAGTFRSRSTSLRRQVYWRKVKFTVAICAAVFLLVYIISAVACNSLIFKGCWSK